MTGRARVPSASDLVDLEALRAMLDDSERGVMEAIDALARRRLSAAVKLTDEAIVLARRGNASNGVLNILLDLRLALAFPQQMFEHPVTTDGGGS